jgi:hypothetical protein
MKKLNRILKPIALLLSIALAAACTKKRDPELSYTENRDLLTLAAFEGKEWDLQTYNVIKPSDSSAKLRLSDERKNAKTKIKTFDYVNYKSEDPLKLTDDTLMLGLPNHHYKVKYLFQGTLLKVMKLAPPEDLATDEKAAAIDNKDGRLMVPIVSYSISLFSTDRQRNDQNETTSKLELISMQSLNGATHFKIDYNSKTRASFLSKTTVLPANFFTGENGESADWYYSMTLVAQNSHEGDEGHLSAPGVEQAYDKYDRKAVKIRAKKLEDKIVFFNLAIDPQVEKSVNDRVENQATVVSLPVEFVDYQLAESGKSVTVKEEASKERAWDQRASMDVKVTEVKVADFAMRISELRDVQISDNYFSFIVKDEVFGGLVRFAFYNVKAYQRDSAQKYGAKPYKPKILFPEDEKLFGFYSTTPEKVNSYEASRKEVADRRNLVNRFNPTRTVVEYRLNQEAPKWTEEIAKQAVRGWNASLQAAGTSFRIRITDENGKVLRGQAGDLRYSLINFMTEADQENYSWLGYGPSLADPNTGEIIMGTANVNAFHHVGAFKNILNQYLQSQKGLMDDKYLMGFSFPAFKVVMQSAQNVVQVVGKGLGFDAFRKNENITIYDAELGQFRKNLKLSADSGMARPTFSSQAQFESTIETLMPEVINSALNQCPEFKKIAEKIHGKKDESIDDEMRSRIVSACAQEVSRPSLISTTVHEMGHNLGLLHNFYGSTDARNFYGPVKKTVNGQEVSVQWKTSSIMDYMPLNEDIMTQPGRYDTAAIRWGYEDKIELENGQVVSVDPTKPTRPRFDNQMRKFKFCDGADAGQFSKDPLCAMFDTGQDPETVVDHLIHEYEAHIAFANNRLGKNKTRDYLELALERKNAFLVPMMKFYEMWRLIVAKEAGSGKEYLESFDSAQLYNGLLQNLFDESRQGKDQAQWNKKYYNAAQKIFQLLVRISFMPDASCVTRREVNGRETIQLFSLTKLQKELFLKTNQTFHSCQDPEIQDYLRQTKGATVVAQGGLPFLNLYSDLSQVRIDRETYRTYDDPETVGLVQDRYFALEALTSRSRELYTSRVHGFAPNFVDEFPFREELKTRINNRLTKGVSIRDLQLDRGFKVEIPENMYSLNFAVEKCLLNEMVGLFKSALYVPGKDNLTDQRLTRYKIRAEYKIKRMNSGIECTQIQGDDYCASKTDNPEAYNLITQYKALDRRKKAWKMPQKSIDLFLSLVMDKIPAKGHGMEATFAFWNTLDKKTDEVRDTDKDLARDLEDLAKLFKPEFDIFAAATKIQREKLSEQDLSKEARDKEFAALFEPKLIDLAKKIGKEKDFKGLDQEILKTRLNEALQKAKDAYEEYQADPTEYDAQADILINALISTN